MWYLTRLTGKLSFEITLTVVSFRSLLCPYQVLDGVFDLHRLFEMGFADQLQEVIRRLPDTRQTLLFSATLPKLLVEFARAGMHSV